MHSRQSRHTPVRGVAPLHRGPQAIASTQLTTPLQHAPNAALLIDFDNVTMGIRSDLASELRSLLSSEIIKGKVAVQRAYADWRRYPQYIVPLAESSIDMIMAPAYGSSKKNATDIRLAVDAMELVFTRPEIGTYILLSGDSDFASLVTKLKEYGKYVIGVGIRESSSDLLVMNCDEYYSYNALAGLVKSSEEEVVKWDPWELVVEAVSRMAKNGDVMRSDRLKQVMQDIDATFDEKNLGMSKFSRFVQDAAGRGLVTITKLENGQLEVGPTNGAARPLAPSETPRPHSDTAERPPREERGGRRGRRGRGRERDRERESRESPPPAAAEHETNDSSAPAPAIAPVPPSATVPATPDDGIGVGGERLTKQEAFDLVARTVADLTGPSGSVLASAVRKRAHTLLGRDSESLSERGFSRILRDAHDAEVIDLRRRGDDYEVSLPQVVAPVAEQLNRASQAHSPAPATASGTPRGMGPRGIPARGRAGGAVPPELLAVGVVEAASSAPAAATPEPADKKPRARGQKAAGRAAPKAKRGAAVAAAAEVVTAPKPRRRGRPRKSATATE